MSRFHRISFVFLALLSLPAVGCVVYPARVEVDSDHTAAFKDVSRVVVDTRNGAIEVRCEEKRSDVHVHAVRFARGLTEEDARSHAEEIEVKAETDPANPSVLRIESIMPVVDANRGLGTTFRIELPPGASLELETRNGTITAVGGRDPVTARTSNGRIELREINANVDGQTSNGRIIARDIAGDVEVRTSNGTIELERVGKESIRATTSNGAIRIADSRGDASLRTSNGSIDMRLTRVPGSPRITAVTGNGRVDVEVPSDVSARLAMHTSNGRVTANLRDVKVAEFESSRSRLSAVLNKGEGEIDIQSSNGSISLRTVGAPAGS